MSVPALNLVARPSTAVALTMKAAGPPGEVVSP